MVTSSEIMRYILFAMASLHLVGCTTAFVPSNNEADRTIVVEGYITAGGDAIPPYVILTETIDFNEEIDLAAVTNLFVNDATVTVNHAGTEYPLTRICEVPDFLIDEAVRVLGFDPTNLGGEACIYVDILQSIPIIEGGSYDLSVDVSTQNEPITATTVIPRSVPIDTIRWDEPPGIETDTLSRLFITITDPPGPDFYRYEISTNGGPFTPQITSVTNDILFDASAFEIPLNNVSEPGSEFDPDAFGLFVIGDSIVLRWLTIDEAHFDFWLSRDFNANSAGPFASYTRVTSNIDGGLGIWGGYYEHQYSLVVE